MGQKQRVGAAGGLAGPLHLLLALSIVGPGLLFLGTAWLDWKSTFRAAGTALVQRSEVAREHASKVFDSQRLTGDVVRGMLAGMDPAAIRASEEVLHARLGRLTADLPQVRTVLVVGAAGQALASSIKYPVPGNVSFTDRDYFRALAAGVPQYVSNVHVGRINGEPIFGLSLPITGDTGAFDGLVDVEISPAYFSRFYGSLIGKAGKRTDADRVTLLRDDGQILVRYPPFPDTAPSIGASSPLAAAIGRDAEGGSYLAPSTLDRGASERLYAYRKVRGYPVYVVASRSLSAIRAEWRAGELGHLLLTVAMIGCLVVASGMALRRSRRERLALERTRQEMRRRRKAEEALRQAQKMEAIGQLTGSVAHDFGNLLTVVISSLETIRRCPERADLIDRLTMSSLVAAQSGADLVKRLLAFSRRQAVQPEIVDLNHLIDQFRPILGRAATTRVALSYDLDPHLGLANVDPVEFQSALLNLAVNARDAMPDGGSLRIATGHAVLTASELADGAGPVPGTYLRVSMSDTGIGMDAATAARVFEPFFTTKEAGKGTGLGLSQVYGFVRQAGGHCLLRSAPGQGCTIELYLPCLTEEAASAAAAARPSRAAAAMAAPRRTKRRVAELHW